MFRENINAAHSGLNKKETTSLKKQTQTICSLLRWLCRRMITNDGLSAFYKYKNENIYLFNNINKTRRSITLEDSQ